MTVQTQYAPSTTDSTTPTGGGSQQSGPRRPVVIGLLVTFAVIAAVVAAGRVMTTSETSTTTTTAVATGELNAKALADRYATARLAPSIRDDTGAWLHRRSISTPTGVQSGYGNPAAVERHVTTTSHELNAKALADRYTTARLAPSTGDDTRNSLRRQARSIGPGPTAPSVPPQLVP